MAPWQETVDPALLMTVNNGGQRCGQIGKWIDGVELAGLYERRDGRPVLGTGVVSSEESIFAESCSKCHKLFIVLQNAP
jgi:hypothetical protein